MSKPISDKQMDLIRNLELDVTIMLATVSNKMREKLIITIETVGEFVNTSSDAAHYINTLKAAQRVVRIESDARPAFRLVGK